MIILCQEVYIVRIVQDLWDFSEFFHCKPLARPWWKILSKYMYKYMSPTYVNLIILSLLNWIAEAPGGEKSVLCKF